MPRGSFISVAPLAGARIEIDPIILKNKLTVVAPLAGARIEMLQGGTPIPKNAVAPLAGARIEIGLASSSAHIAHNVAPLAGARIEIYIFCPPFTKKQCRSPRGSED